MSGVTHLAVRGFKSINALERFELGSLNVLIGPNGSGKSNYHGVRLATCIGLDRIRSECHHFGAWLSRMESLQPLNVGPSG